MLTTHIFFFALHWNPTKIVTRIPRQHLNCSALLTPANTKSNQKKNKKKTSHCRHVWYLNGSPQIHRRHCCLNIGRLKSPRGKRVCIWWICADLISLCGQSLKQQKGLVGSVSWWVVCVVGGQGLGSPSPIYLFYDSHLGVGHRGLASRVSVSCRGGAGPVFWRGLAVSGGLIDWLLGQGSHWHQGVGLVLLVHLVGFGLREAQTQHRFQKLSNVLEINTTQTNSILLI